MLIVIKMEKKQVIASLLTAGASKVDNLKVKNVNVTPMENYVRVSLSLDKSVTGYVTKDEGVTYEKGETKVIFVSLYSIASILRDNEQASAIVNHIVENPKSLMVLLNGANITILQEEVANGQVYKNPWSDNAEETTFEHDAIVNHIIDIKLGALGTQGVSQIMMSMLGI